MPTKGQIQYIKDCYENFVEDCGIRHHTFVDIWFNGPKYFLYSFDNANPLKFVRRRCIALYLQFSNILEDCNEYNITDEDLEYSFYLNDMKKFIDTYREFVEGQLTKPTFIL